MWKTSSSALAWPAPLSVPRDAPPVSPPAAQQIRIAVALAEAGSATIAATLFVPASPLPAKPIALFCFPGGGMARRYFDLDQASFAAAMAARGFITATFDHPGIGESTTTIEGFALTADIIAEAGAQAGRALQQQLQNGTAAPHLPPLPNLTILGVGHSMGGMIVTMQQAAYRPYAALALLGFSTHGLPGVLTPPEREIAARATRTATDYATLARLRFGTPLPVIPARANGAAALTEASAPLLAVSALQSMLPGNIAPQAAAIDVPVFLAVGDRDIAGPPETIPAAFTSAPGVKLYVMPDAGHHPFIAPSAPLLYAELAAWASNAAFNAVATATANATNAA
jgi:pimeloyl-ACP methyl ester carboxylesterase